MNNSNLTNQDRAQVLLTLMQRRDPAVAPALEQLVTIASGKGKEAEDAEEVLKLVDMGTQGLIGSEPPVQFARKGTTFKSNCNCPSRLAKQGGKLVIVDCHGKILR